MNDAPNILDDLFTNPESRGTDPRYQPAVEVDEGPPMLASTERMAFIFRDQVARVMPPAADIERMRTEGYHLDEKGQKQKGHRFRLERNNLPIEGFIGKVYENQWAYIIHMLMDRGTLGTFHHALRHEQSNGDWVPVQVDARLAPAERRIITKNATRPSRLQLPETEDKMSWLNDGPILDNVSVAVETFEYAIVWMDRNNAPNMQKVDAQGKPVGQQEVNVRVEAGGTDPALVNAFMAQGQAMQALAGSVQALADRPVNVSVNAAPVVAEPAPSSAEKPTPGAMPGNVPWTPGGKSEKKS